MAGVRFQLAKAHGLVLLGSTLVLLADGLSKLYIRHNLSPGQSVPVINGVFHITRTHNTGAAFSMFYQHPEVLTVVAALLVSVFVAYLLNKSDLTRYEVLGFSLLLGGAVGNLLDRVTLGAVTDFLDLVWIHYPVFNLADSFIVVGMGLLFLNYVKPAPYTSRS